MGSAKVTLLVSNGFIGFILKLMFPDYNKTACARQAVCFRALGGLVNQSNFTVHQSAVTWEG
ncbi:hypothetical protein ACTHUD_25265, partial [Neisseria sp. P0016.S002]